MLRNSHKDRQLKCSFSYHVTTMHSSFKFNLNKAVPNNYISSLLSNCLWHRSYNQISQRSRQMLPSVINIKHKRTDGAVCNFHYMAHGCRHGMVCTCILVHTKPTTEYSIGCWQHTRLSCKCV